MARSTSKSLAGTAAAVAKKVIGRQGSATPAATTGDRAETNGTAKKAPVKKVSAKTSSSKKAAAVVKTPAKKAPATKSAAKKTTAQTPPKTTPVKRAPVAKNPTPDNSGKLAPPAKAAPAAKKAATKASASSLVVKQGEESWSKAELDEVIAELHSQHDKLAHVIEDAEAELVGLMKDAGDGAGHDQADMGATSFERDHELTVVNIERDMVAQIDKALARIDDGTYGVCEACGEAIGKMRLMAFPRATLCLPCKQREERR